MIRLRRVLATTLLAVALLIAVPGCSSGGGGLEGTSWKLTGWSLSSLSPADFTITAAFVDGQISGRSAVNSYGGPFQAGPGDAFKVGETASTMMAGEEPAMRAESAFMTLLQEARSFKVADGVLTLYDANGNESLIFEVSK
jgi:heat shock protein HslJ